MSEPGLRSTAPRWLDPILSFAERVDRRRRRIHRIRLDGLLAVQLVRHRGPRLVLADGTIVAPGDLVVSLHFWNESVAEVSTGGWERTGWETARADLAALVEWWRRQAPRDRPVALLATTILAPLTRRERWEIRPRPRTWRTRLDEWYMRWLLAHWSKGGRARLGRSHAPLLSVDAWLSASAVEARYGAAATSDRTRPSAGDPSPTFPASTTRR